MRSQSNLAQEEARYRSRLTGTIDYILYLRSSKICTIIEFVPDHLLLDELEIATGYLQYSKLNAESM